MGVVCQGKKIFLSFIGRNKKPERAAIIELDKTLFLDGFKPKRIGTNGRITASYIGSDGRARFVGVCYSDFYLNSDGKIWIREKTYRRIFLDQKEEPFWQYLGKLNATNPPA